MVRSMSPDSIVFSSVILCEPTRLCDIVSSTKLLTCFLIHIFYLGRSAWIYCVTSFGVPSPLSRNRFLTLYFLLSSIQYSRQMIILCCRYKHGYRGHYLAQLLHYYGARLSH